LYTARGDFIKELSGTVDLPPHTTMPIFTPGIALGTPSADRAFLEIASSSPTWFTLSTDPRNVPVVSHIVLGGTTAVPRIEATLTNDSIEPITNVRVVSFVRDTSTNNVIAASATVVPVVPAQGSASAVFVWNEAFRSPSVRIEVVPVLPLP
jgi:hypothetical protein